MAAKPLLVTPVSRAEIVRGDGAMVTKFLERFAKITKSSVGGRAGEPMRLQPFQKTLTGQVFARRADGRLKHREALIGLPRKNGKSSFTAGWALYTLVTGDNGSEIISASATKDQARLVFGTTRTMVEMDETLKGELKVYRDAIENLATGSYYKVVSAEAYAQEGLNPSLVILDELHAFGTPDLYDVMALAQGARIDPLLISITTAGARSDQTGQDSICYQRYQHGEKVASGEIADPGFFMSWFGAPDGADHRSPAVWKQSNPGYGTICDPEDFETAITRVHEAEWRTRRLNQWVASARAWLPHGSWDACKSAEAFTEPERGVVLGFDGSRTGDATALVAVTVEEKPQVKVLGLWERPVGVAEWKVPREEVKDAIRQARRDYTVRELAADEFIWTDALEELADEGVPVVAFPQLMSRMNPATQRFFEMVQQGKLRHDGDPRLARHLRNAVIKTDQRGSRLAKDARHSARKIDLAVAAVIAVDRAAWWLTQPRPGYVGDVKAEDVMYVW